MALLAKNKGMVIICPIPMNRSLVLTRQAIISERVANIAAPITTVNATNMMFKGLRSSPTPMASANK